MKTSDPTGGLFESWSSLAGLLPGVTAGAGPAPLMALLMQAHVGSSSSLLRAGQRASESWLQYLKESGTDAPIELRVDAARGHLRRLAEIAADEARLVAQQMQVLDEQLRGLVPGADAAEGGPAPAGDPGSLGEGGVSDPVRRARAKP